jgi:hypothetical protein
MGQMRERVIRRAIVRRRTVAIVVALTGALATLGSASPALAGLKQDIQHFSDCPVENPEAGQCVYALTTSGEFVLGKSAVPITKPVTIQGGLTPPLIVPAADGNTLSKTPLTVPGGLTGLGLLGETEEVTATAEVAGQGSIQFEVNLPVKVKLDNVTLGSSCYIGTEAEPLDLQLSYSSATITTKDNGEIKAITGTLFGNKFAAPGASGCTAVPAVGDAVINAKEGLPAAAGSNSATMNGVTEEISAQVVRAERPLPDFGRCEKAKGVLEGKKTVFHGAYTSAACTTEAEEKTGKFEWTTGPGPSKKFSGTGTKVSLEGVGHSLVSCTASTNEGEYTGPKTETVTLKLTGCTKGKGGAACQSSGAAAGEIQTVPLNGSLDFIKEGEAPATPEVGLDLAPLSGTSLATFECGGSPVTVEGSAIVPISTVNKMDSSFKLKAKATSGIQAPESFEAGSKDTLTIGGEQAGVSATGTSTNEEPLEIKATI